MIQFQPLLGALQAMLECPKGLDTETLEAVAVDQAVAHSLVSRSKPVIVPEMRLFGVANPQLMN
jgi:hypothetical protein